MWFFFVFFNVNSFLQWKIQVENKFMSFVVWTIGTSLILKPLIWCFCNLGSDWEHHPNLIQEGEPCHLGVGLDGP